MTDNTTIPDPLADAQHGDDDPIGPFDETNICGATTATGSNGWNTAECVREPHPDDWNHVSCCDDRIDFVWRSIPAADLELAVLTDEGVVYRCCAALMDTGGSHEVGCKGLAA